MSAETFYIVSDLHLGSDYSHHGDFLAWLDALPPGATVILNGDMIDAPGQPLSAEHRGVLARLARESQERPVIWVYGNHDAGLVLDDPGQIRFAQHWEIGMRLLIVHGSDFDEIMPRHGLFKALFHLLHDLRALLGFRRVHVAEYAKRWEFLYRVLNDHVAHNALRAAASRGFEAVTCGHTHSPMQMERDGRRYYNTGAWTERPLHYLEVDAAGIALRVYEPGTG